MALFGKKTDDKAQIATDEVKEAKDAKLAKQNPLLGLPEILISPRVSEKAGQLIKANQYVFLVKRNANKVEIKKAVEKKFKVRVLRVNTIKTKGKPVHSGKFKGKRQDFKKAIVSLKEGDKIPGFMDIA